jgi:hypothetical protein
LCHRLTDLVTLSLGLSVGGCDEQGQQKAQSLHNSRPLFSFQRDHLSRAEARIGTLYPILRAGAEADFD